MSPLAWSFLLSGLGIIGILLAGSKRKVGWLVGFAVQPLWIVFAINTEQYGFILNAVIYAAVYARNWWLWHRQETAGARYEKKRRAALTPHQRRVEDFVDRTEGRLGNHQLTEAENAEWDALMAERDGR